MTDFKLKWKIPREFKTLKANIEFDAGRFSQAIFFGATLKDGSSTSPAQLLDHPEYGALNRIQLDKVFAGHYKNTEDFKESFEQTAVAFVDALRKAEKRRRRLTQKRRATSTNNSPPKELSRPFKISNLGGSSLVL